MPDISLVRSRAFAALLTLSLASAATTTIVSPSAYALVFEGSEGDNQTPTSVITPPPAAAGAGPWHLHFNDEFDDDRLDSGKWKTCDTGLEWANGCSPAHAGTLAMFQPDALVEQDGMLRVIATQRTVTATNGPVFEYTSGQISSEDRFQFQYGYMEIRARVPQGRGMFPSFFTLPSDARFFPPEIDVFELLGNDTTRAYLTNHFDGQGPFSTTRTAQGVFEYQPGFHDGFHVYAADWQPGLVVWYVDGIERFRTSDRVTKEPHKILAQLAVGIQWQDNYFVDTSTQVPSFYDIDYIRVWKRGAQPTALFDGFDDAGKLYTASPNIRVNLEPKQPNDTGRISRKSPEPGWVVWRLENTAVATATVLYWPNEGVNHVKFFASADNATYTEAPTQINDRGGDWRRVDYVMNMPPGTNYMRALIPQSGQSFAIQIASVGLTRATGLATATPSPTRTPTPQPTAFPGEMLDELNNVSGMLSRSSRLRLESIFPERFGGDASRLIRWSLDNEWGQWRVRGGADVRITTYHWQGEPIKHFGVMTSSNGVTLTAVSPVSATTPTNDPQWLQVEYSFKLAPETLFLRMVYPRNNYNHSPQIGRVRTSQTGFPNLEPTPVPTSTPPPAATTTPGPAQPTATPGPVARLRLLLPVVAR